MIAQDILEGNKIIAEFLGINPQRIVSEMPINKDGNYCNGNGDLDKYGNPCYLVYAPSLQYNSSWDWLMPVVEKIHKMEEYTEEYTSEQVIYAPILQAIPLYGITGVWREVVEFIKWYNQQK